VIRLRPAEPQDDYLWWQLRRELDQTLTWEAHQEWWKTFEHRYVLYDGPVTVGGIRISPFTPEIGVISIHLVKGERGKGLGTQALISIKRVAKELGFTRLVARIDVTNRASQQAFTNASFSPTQMEVLL
jgi:RimJ/RimL family protein N-acetyltransferase